MVGTGHSFTAISAPEATMLRPDALTGIVAVDREAMTVTARSGTRLADLNAALEALGLSLHNMGDIAEQTLAGAISTGTHGTGGLAAGLAAQVVGLELVTGTGELLRATPDEHADVLDVARVGLGRPRRPHHDHLPGRAAVRARGRGAADVVGRGARQLRRDDRRPPTTSTCTGSPTPTGC